LGHLPRLRGIDPGLPFDWPITTLKRGLNFRLTSALGDIDLFGEIARGGTYSDLISQTIEVQLFGVVPLPRSESLIRTKRAARRMKDLEVIAEPEALAEEQED
jgi:hypothetical protein